MLQRYTSKEIFFFLDQAGPEHHHHQRGFLQSDLVIVSGDFSSCQNLSNPLQEGIKCVALLLSYDSELNELILY